MRLYLPGFTDQNHWHQALRDVSCSSHRLLVIKAKYPELNCRYCTYSNMKKDLENEADVKLLVDTFYDKVNSDSLLAPIFNDFAEVDWQHHLPTMYRFWSSVLFGSTAYKGQPFPKHLRLPITPLHFSQWLHLFETTVEELFSGETAASAKVKAHSIAQMFQLKMGFLEVIDRAR